MVKQTRGDSGRHCVLCAAGRQSPYSALDSEHESPGLRPDEKWPRPDTRQTTTRNKRL